MYKIHLTEKNDSDISQCDWSLEDTIANITEGKGCFTRTQPLKVC